MVLVKELLKKFSEFYCPYSMRERGGGLEREREFVRLWKKN